jgi:thioredoxin 1
MSVTEVHNDEEFKTQTDAAKEQSKTMFIKFSAKWCGPCKTINPVFVTLSETYPKCVFLHVDVDGCEEASAANEIMSLPTFLVIKDGVCVERLKGANKNKLSEFVVKHANS